MLCQYGEWKHITCHLKRGFPVVRKRVTLNVNLNWKWTGHTSYWFIFIFYFLFFFKIRTGSVVKARSVVKNNSHIWGASSVGILLYAMGFWFIVWFIRPVTFCIQHLRRVCTRKSWVAVLFVPVRLEYTDLRKRVAMMDPKEPAFLQTFQRTGTKVRNVQIFFSPPSQESFLFLKLI